MKRWISHTNKGRLMNFRYKRITTTMVFFLVFAVTQVYLGISFAVTPSSHPAAGAPQVAAVLTTQGNKPITVNGASAVSGATILSGATIETPDRVSATINIPGHGVLEIAPNTKLTLEFDQNGNIKVMMANQGCAVLHTTKGTSGEIDNDKGVVGKTGGARDEVIEVCPGVKIAGAAAGGGGGLFGLGTAASVAIIGGGVGTAVGIALANRGANPSPSAP
jgi:hypothetical protein